MSAEAKDITSKNRPNMLFRCFFKNKTRGKVHIKKANNAKRPAHPTGMFAKFMRDLTVIPSAVI